MFKRYASGVLVAATVLALSLTGCASEPRADAPAAEQQTHTASATELASMTTRGLELDYDPLASPKAAVTASELIVRGKLVDVVEGISYGGKAAQAGRANAYATFVIEVDTSLDGSVAQGAKVYAQVNKSSTSSPGDLAKLGKGLDVVAVLDDISDWTPAPGVTVVRPDVVPTTGPLYFAFPDGLWMKGRTDKAMVGTHARASELSAAWGAPQTLDQYWAALEKADR